MSKEDGSRVVFGRSPHKRTKVARELKYGDGGGDGAAGALVPRRPLPVVMGPGETADPELGRETLVVVKEDPIRGG